MIVRACGKSRVSWPSALGRGQKRSLSSALSDPFSSPTKQVHRERSAKLFLSQGVQNAEFEYLRDAVAEQVVDRISDIARDFPLAVDLGCNTGNVYRELLRQNQDNIGKLIQLDECKAMTDAASQYIESEKLPTSVVHGKLESMGGLKANSVDMVLSSMSLHWTNDLPRLLKSVHRVLKPDGVFLGAMVGGESLFELRTALAFAEQEREGGVSPHVSPMVRHADACGLLSSAGFSLTTVDTTSITVEFKDLFSCIEHLAGMGESSANKHRRPTLSRDTLAAAAATYQGLFGDETGYVPATFEIIFMIGWKPHESQPKPLAPGSHTESLGKLGKSYTDIQFTPTGSKKE